MHNSPTFIIMIFALFFSGLLVQSVVGQKAATNGFFVDLIHRDSPLSPFYNDSITSSQLLRKNALHSMDRIKSIQSNIDQQAIQSVVIPNGGSYLMKLSFGTPPVEYLAIADTGSDLIWIQCAPCPQTQCYSQGSSPFDPAASSTYQKLSCVSEACQALHKKSCFNTNECQYMYSYGDKSYTIGILSTDTLSFDSQNSFPKSVFGCGHNNQGNFRSPGAGLVGLGGGALSLVSQIGTQINHRFSYCLVPRSATCSGKLSFGKDSIISRPGVVSTRLITKTPATFYFLNLEGISIGAKTAQAATSSQRNIIIDSGTTLTILESNFYNSLESMVKQAIGAESEQDPSGTFSLCYGAQTNIPDMTFHFTGGADLRLQPINTFRLNDGLLCMLIIPSPFNGLSIFGNYAQINFEVEYDLQKRTVSFAPTDCTKQ